MTAVAYQPFVRLLCFFFFFVARRFLTFMVQKVYTFYICDNQARLAWLSLISLFNSWQRSHSRESGKQNYIASVQTYGDIKRHLFGLATELFCIFRLFFSAGTNNGDGLLNINFAFLKLWVTCVRFLVIRWAVYSEHSAEPLCGAPFCCVFLCSFYWVHWLAYRLWNFWFILVSTLLHTNLFDTQKWHYNLLVFYAKKLKLNYLHLRIEMTFSERKERLSWYVEF